MAATTACAYGYERSRPPPPAPLLELHLGGRSSKETPRRHLDLCTEGLGSESSESSGDVDVVDADDIDAGQRQQWHGSDKEGETPARARSRRAFPPPISVIGSGGKPWLYLRAHRGGGRLVLREVRIPSRELLQAYQEDGRLKLHFAHPDDDEEEAAVQDQRQEQQVND